MSELFHKIEGEIAIIQSKGVHYQVDIYARKGEVYARKGAGFIRLLSNNRTSHPDTFWNYVSVNVTVSKLGYLTAEN